MWRGSAIARAGRKFISSKLDLILQSSKPRSLPPGERCAHTSPATHQPSPENSRDFLVLGAAVSQVWPAELARASTSTTHPADAEHSMSSAAHASAASAFSSTSPADAAAAALANAEPATELAPGPADAAAAAPADAGLAAAAELMDTSQPLPTVGAWAQIARRVLDAENRMLCTGCGVSFGYGYV